MARTETVTLTVMCMVYQEDKILMQNRKPGKDGYVGLALPGGHVEKGESFVQATKREMKEETGLTVDHLCLCGVKQFQPQTGDRYLVMLYKTDTFAGEVTSSEEGEMLWITREELKNYPTVRDIQEVLEIMDNENVTELFYQKNETSGEHAILLY